MKTILFIEDESVLQKTLGDFLTKEGYEMMSALDGEAGLALAQKKIPDLILLDLILPKVNGFEVLEKLKQDEKTKNIPIIITTNLEDMNSVQRAIESGADTYLVKANYSLKEVAEKIRKILEK